MPVYTYSATDALARLSSGTIVAETPADARERLRERGLRLRSFSRASLRSSGRSFFRRTGSGAAVAEAARYLALLLRADSPLTEALSVLARQSKGALHEVLCDVRDRVESGSGLADALAAHPAWFDSFFVSAVRIGELSGELDTCLDALAAHLRRRDSLRGKVISAAAYPAILCALGLGVTLFLMTFVVPQLMEVLSASGRVLPTSTRLVKSAADLLLMRWYLLAGAAAGAATLGMVLWRRPKIRRCVERAALKLPLLGSLIRKRLVAEFAGHLALLLETGQPFLEALRSLQAETRSRVLEGELAAMGTAIERGEEIARSMGESRVFPPVVIHLVGVGQRSGELAAMLQEVAERYEHEVDQALTRLTSALEPALIVLLAAGIGFVVYACLMPILEATRVVL